MDVCVSLPAWGDTRRQNDLSQLTRGIAAMIKGQLVVFEGPDGVGKSELAARFESWLVEHGSAAELLSFPGKEEGTLGKLVYDLHSNPARFGVTGLTATSLQALHVAAHLDAIQRRIIPAIKSNRTIVLDRFWWSTYVYGIASDVDREILERMIATEKAAWGMEKPSILFLIDRGQPLRPEPSEFWIQCREEYRRLFSTERTQYPCEAIANEGSIEETLNQLIQCWRKSFGDTTQEEPKF
jgi:thymidylate kinase